MNQKALLKNSIETQTVHLVDCCACGTSWESEYETATSFVKTIYDSGWRYLESEKYQVEGPMCPKCAQLDDDARFSGE